MNSYYPWLKKGQLKYIYTSALIVINQMLSNVCEKPSNIFTINYRL